VTVTAPRYRVQFYKFSSNFGIGDLIVELENTLNLAYGDYANDVPECFFTLMKNDPKAQVLAAYAGRCHIRVLRWSESPGYDDVAFAGWLMEANATQEDIVFTCYGYLAGLFWSLTDWDQRWDKAPVSTIVSDLWTRAKTQTYSMLQWITTGTIEAPATETGGSTPIVLPLYEAFYKRILFVMREMSALGASDTLNTPKLEITHSATPTFNFWANKGVDRPSVRWEWGDGIMRSYQFYGLPVFRRNDLKLVGASPRADLLREDLAHETDMSFYGRREEPLFFQWVRDTDELHRAGLIRSRLARQDSVDLAVAFYPNSFPPVVPASPQKILDRAKVKISDGILNVDEYYLITGFQCIYARGQENSRMLLRVMYENDNNLFALDTDRLMDVGLVLDTVP
jgi:hypothetical protein